MDDPQKGNSTGDCKRMKVYLLTGGLRPTLSLLIEYYELFYCETGTMRNKNKTLKKFIYSNLTTELTLLVPSAKKH